MVNPIPIPVRPAKVTAPSHLGKPEVALFHEIVRSYRLGDEVSLTILEEALTSLMRARLARELIDKQGLTFIDKHKQPRLHPACNVERDARAAALSAFRQLNLELPRTATIR